MAGEVPAHPVAIDELARRVEAEAEEKAVGYVFGAAGREVTMAENAAAFRRARIVPRMLRDVGERNLSVEVCNTRMPAPLGLAPIGVQSIAHPDGELAVARAAAAVGLTMCVSTVSSSTLEEIAAAAPGPKWFQLYWPRNPELTTSFVQRAELAGYEAIVVTLDTFLPGWKTRDLQRAWQPFLEGVGIANYLADPVFGSLLSAPPEEDRQGAIGQFVYQFSNPELTWKDLEHLRAATELPIMLKGILHPDDARLAAEAGIDGVVVSNHGGRQVDGAIASLDALPDVAEAAGDELAVLLDSGIRSGADAFKAIALGADAALVGRPYLWGLANDGEAGVLAVLRGLLAELDLTVGLSGYRTIAEIGPDALSVAGD
jgi:isopentenyl diphosphate isomerase/L-lactate dehydrogenase-like FMN-dependent dehydrogenase